MVSLCNLEQSFETCTLATRSRLLMDNTAEPYRSSMGISANPRDSKYNLPARICGASQYDEDKDILPYLLGDRLFYLALALSASLTTPYAQQLWELFGTHPGHLLALYASLSSSAHGSGCVSADLSWCLASALSSQQRTSATSSPSSSGDSCDTEAAPSLDALMNIITRKLDGSSVIPHEMLLRQIKAQLRRVQQDLKSRPELG